MAAKACHTCATGGRSRRKTGGHRGVDALKRPSLCSLLRNSLVLLFSLPPVRSRIAEDRTERTSRSRGRGENAKDEEEDATQKPIASLYEERKGDGMTGSPRRFGGSRVRRESDERKSIGTGYIQEERAREERERGL